MISIDDCIRKLHSLRHLREAEDAIQFAIEVLKEKQKNDLGAHGAAAVATDTPADTPREVWEWCPSDKRVRCINCRYLHRHNEDEAQCYNEDGPVAMWMFLADSEPKETWCEAFRPNDWLSNQIEMKELRKP
jgi:hypothetical protein